MPDEQRYILRLREDQFGGPGRCPFYLPLFARNTRDRIFLFSYWSCWQSKQAGNSMLAM